ncbi:MAG: domain protein beta Propeller [Anaerolineales bacterium]|nr:domain protein beta Propeller [Anaerolineales bacterium]
MCERTSSHPRRTFRADAVAAGLLLSLAACSPTAAPVSGSTPSPIPELSATVAPPADPARPTIPFQGSTPASTPVRIPTEETLEATPRHPQCQPTDERAHVLDVRDGDTIQVRLETGEIETVRYIGINAPEQGEALFQFSAEANESLVMGRDVCLWKDVSDRDRYGRLLRFVSVDSVFVNDWLVVNGFAAAWAYYPDTTMAAQFEESQQAAMRAGVGLWGLRTPTTAPPPATLDATAAPGSCDPSYPTVCISPLGSAARATRRLLKNAPPASPPTPSPRTVRPRSACTWRRGGKRSGG